MKPLNSNTEGCNPISSNCVIWQGPDIECIKLCKGDTVSDVVYKLATELCMLIEMTDVKSYDLACIKVNGCDPKDFQELIQVIINKVCNDNGVPVGDPVGRFSGGSDTIVPIAECFYYKTELGDTVTTMPVSDYARAIGNKLCDVIAQILTINEILTNHEERITNLENTPIPIPVIPQVTPVCVAPSLATPMETVLSAVELQFCELRSATGLPTQLYASIAAECVNLSNQKALSPFGGIMATYPGWVISPANVADTINNIWLTICDLRAAVQYIKDNCCPGGCDGIAVSLTATFDGTFLKLYFTGNVPAGFFDCDSMGSLFNITDDGANTVSQRVPITTYMNVPGGYSINLSGSALNLASNFTIKTDACFYNGTTSTSCQFCLEYFLDNTAVCPTLSLTTTTDTAVNYSFAPFVVPATYTVQLWDSAGLTVLSQNIVSVLSIGLQTGVFNGLTASTSYRLRIVVSTGATTTDCPFVPFTTTPVVCTEPTAVGGLIELPTICPMCGPVVDFVSNAGVDDGYYIDDVSPYLFLRSGGTFNSIYTDVYQASMPGLAPTSVTLRNSATTALGDTYISYNVSGGASPSIIYHYDNTGTLLNTITLPNAGASYINCSAIDYSKFDGKVYFVSWATALLNPLSVYVLDPADDSYTKLVNISAALIGFPGIRTNPLNGHLMFANNLGSIQIGDPSTDTMINTGLTAIPESGFPVVNESNGYIWVMRNGLNTIKIWDVSGVTPVNVGTATAPAGYLARIGSANGGVFPITYYPGDGTPGTDRMFAVFNDPVAPVLPTLTDVIEFDANAPYTATIFTSLPYQYSPVNVKHSTSFTKIFLSYGNTIDAYSPTDGSVSFASITTAGVNLLWPYEDTANKQIVYFNMAANPINNIYWIGLDTTNAVACTEELVNFYQVVSGNNEGPYAWDNATLSWPSACTFAVTDLGTSFSVVATFPGITYQSGILVYSVNNGLTWNNYGDFKTEAEFNAGVTYNKSDVLPYTTFMLRIAFLTDDNCGLASKIDTTFN